MKITRKTLKQRMGERNIAGLEDAGCLVEDESDPNILWTSDSPSKWQKFYRDVWNRTRNFPDAPAP